jgi:hypothetical protein
MPSGPVNQGVASPPIIRSVSPAAGLVLAGAIAATPGSYELPFRSRSIVDQQELPCCVSCALGAAVEVLNATWPPLSPLFHYYVARYVDGGANPAGFLFVEDALNTLVVKGICTHDLDSVLFTDAWAATQPTAAAYTDAQARSLSQTSVRPWYQQALGVSNAAWIRDQLNQNHPVIVSFQLPMTYPDTFLDQNFEWTDPNKFAASDSGHCVLVTGYNDARRTIHIQDSHGTGKFDQGRWWMGYGIVDSPQIQAVYCLLS